MEAAQAGPHLLRPAPAQLIGKVGVGDQAAGHFQHVGLAGSQDLFHLLRLPQSAHGGHGDAHGLLHRLGILHVAAVGLEHAGVGDGHDLLHLMVAHAGVDQVHIGFQLLCDGDALVDAVAPGVALAGADAHLDGEAGTHGLPHRLAHRDGVTAAVFQAAAPLVLPGIQGGGQELMEAPAVAHVDHDHAEAAFFRRGRRLREFGDGRLDHALRHLLDETPAQLHFHGPVGLPLGNAAEHGQGTVGIHPRMGQLRRGHRPVAGDGEGQLAQGDLAGGIVDADLVGASPPEGRVHDQLPRGHGGAAAHGLAPVVLQGLLGIDTVVGHVAVARGGRKEAVQEKLTPQADGLEDMGIAHLAHGHSSPDMLFCLYYTTNKAFCKYVFPVPDVKNRGPRFSVVPGGRSETKVYLE